MKTYVLPWPPSVNMYWRSTIKGGRIVTYLSSEAKAFRVNVQAVVLSEGRGKTMEGQLWLRIAAYPPDRRERDFDNILKGLCDSLAHAGVYKSDSQIKDCRIEMLDPEKPGRVKVSIGFMGE